MLWVQWGQRVQRARRTQSALSAWRTRWSSTGWPRLPPTCTGVRSCRACGVQSGSTAAGSTWQPARPVARRAPARACRPPCAVTPPPPQSRPTPPGLPPLPWGCAASWSTPPTLLLSRPSRRASPPTWRACRCRVSCVVTAGAGSTPGARDGTAGLQRREASVRWHRASPGYVGPSCRGCAAASVTAAAWCTPCKAQLAECATGARRPRRRCEKVQHEPLSSVRRISWRLGLGTQVGID